jgi:hypothetical protein
MLSHHVVQHLAHNIPICNILQTYLEVSKIIIQLQFAYSIVEILATRLQKNAH